MRFCDCNWNKTLVVGFQEVDYIHDSHFLSIFIDVDECASSELNECDSKALCTNSDGSYICRCLSGYQGDGRSCTGKYFFQLFLWCVPFDPIQFLGKPYSLFKID